MTGEKRAGEGGSSASAQTLPFLSVPARLHCVGGQAGAQQKGAAGRAVRIPCEGVWSVCYPKTLSCFRERVAVDWGLGGGGGVTVTDGLRVVGAFVDGGVCLNRDVLPPAL